MYLCNRGITNRPLSTILIFDFGIIPTLCYFCFVFHLSEHGHLYLLDMDELLYNKRSSTAKNN
jgi:hypothetical protein